nr:MAG TPA: hypothetical protein [Caudoviricetes sp.]
MTKAIFLLKFGYSLADVATICVNEFREHRRFAYTRYRGRLAKTDLFGGYQKMGEQK